MWSMQGQVFHTRCGQVRDLRRDFSAQTTTTRAEECEKGFFRRDSRRCVSNKPCETSLFPSVSQEIARVLALMVPGDERYRQCDPTQMRVCVASSPAPGVGDSPHVYELLGTDPAGRKWTSANPPICSTAPSLHQYRNGLASDARSLHYFNQDRNNHWELGRASSCCCMA